MRITFSKSSSSSSNKNKAKNKRTPRRSPTRTQNAILDDDDVFLSSLSSLRASFSFSLFCAEMERMMIFVFKLQELFSCCEF